MRFEYDRLSPEQFRQALDEAGIAHGAFTRIFGLNLRTVERWLSGENDIPVWVTIALAMMAADPASRAVAKDAAAWIIAADKDDPNSGPYPYRERRNLPLAD
ncbi:MAG: hypothetical protein O9972_39775 [Burkholderiales bacterium]|nr:hypothetical protein [Burkholderiales bacterium]